MKFQDVLQNCVTSLVNYKFSNIDVKNTNENNLKKTIKKSLISKSCINEKTSYFFARLKTFKIKSEWYNNRYIMRIMLQ